MQAEMNKSSMKKIVFGILPMCVLLAGCHRGSQYESLRDRPLPVEIEIVGECDREVTNTYVGEITAKSDIPLVFPFGGQLTSIQVKSGQKVREGQVIAMVDDTQAKSALESADAILAQAKDGYNRLKPVHQKGGVSDVKWMEMETNLQKARSMAISARKRYEDCTLRAPQAGVVNLSDVEVGQQLMIGQRIGSLLDLSGKKAAFTVPESEIGHLMHGEKLTVSLPALGLSFNAKVDEKALISTRLAHTYRVTALLEDNEAVQDLLPGMVCRAVIVNRLAKGYVISAGCVQTQQTGHSVWVLRNGRAERVMIKIADFVENGVLVSEGLTAGDTVVSKGYQKMFHGARVTF